ncbi:Lysine or histidine methyltransferase [Podospora pseudopauciseta]|uniref:Lysine or histidine methyltransferase n=1 Tax=Podospora pseudopauciseta TaxID=2093780 RepID=A0ABR0H8C7_9PEZI|nr:Lysine or histidine methyltransferase [Podospora pseudopauciseta]
MSTMSRLEISLSLQGKITKPGISRLLRLYGFVVPGNPDDSYDLVLATHPNAPFFEQKHKLWVSAGLDSTCTIPLTLPDPLPKNVLRYLRIQRSDESDLAAIAFRQINATDGKISDSNEVEVLRFLIESFSHLLDSFGTQLEKLEEQLVEGVYSPGGNAWAAAHVSLGEQRVLKLARKRAEDLLSAVESGSGNVRGSLSALARCANCGKVPAQYMLCGRCKAVAYCGRTCQVAHYKEHKAICRATASKSGSGMK